MGQSASGPKAAQYLRRSTGLQSFSLEHQADAIAAYAHQRGYEIVATFSDGDRSGLTLEGRPALQALLAAALDPQRAFSTILVYDVSRWGRFQDLDQGAHYEFLCRQAGVKVAYCAEPFENDGAPDADLIKQVKRAIAAEYSRALSARVAAAKQQIAAKGLIASGAAPFGYRRQVIDPRGRPVAVLAAGERKIAQGYRTRLVPGPPDEVAAVRQVFRLYVLTGLSRPAIAAHLTAEGVVAPSPGPWTADQVRRTLRRETYAGVHLYGRSRQTLTAPRHRLPAGDWGRVEDAWPPLVPRAWFEAAEALRRPARRSDAEMLDDLRRLLARRGRLDSGLIDETPGLLKACSYIRRFGGLRCAYRLIGYQPGRKGERTPAT